MEGQQPSEKYRPYTNNIFKRKECGLPFSGITLMVIGITVQYSIIYLRDCIEQDKIAAAVVVTFLAYSLCVMIYWSYLKTFFTDAGSVSSNWRHPLAEEAKDEQPEEHFRNKRKELDPNLPEKYIKVVDAFKFNSRNYSLKTIKNDSKVGAQEVENRSEDSHHEMQTSAIIEHSENNRYKHKSIVVDNFRYRQCKICMKPKPPRTHHCRTCNRCILKMDHHCPFVGNCIGFNNHKFFILFNFYSTISSALLVIVYIHGIAVFKFANGDPTRYIVGYIFPIIFLIFVFFTALFFLCSHFLYDLINVTTLEIYVSISIRPFDTKSWLLNLKDSFGDPKTKLLWFLPIDASSSFCRKKQSNQLVKMSSRSGDKDTDGHQYYFQAIA